MFLAIVQEGTGKTWEHKHKLEWDKTVRPILEAFFHAKHFLEMAVKYGQELEGKPIPGLLPSGLAAFIYLYNLR